MLRIGLEANPTPHTTSPKLIYRETNPSNLARKATHDIMFPGLLRIIWQALRIIWQALGIIWQALRIIWQALRIVCEALGSLLRYLKKFGA